MSSMNEDLIKQAFQYEKTARSLAKQGDHEGAIKEFENVLKVLPEYVDAYLGIAIAYEQIGNWQKALENYNFAIDINPHFDWADDTYDYGDPYYGRGVLMAKTGHFHEAIKDLTIRIQNHPDHAYAYQKRGVCFLKTSNYVAAIEDFTKFIKLSPNPGHEVYNQRSRAYYELRLYREAIEDLTTSLKINDAQPDAYFNRALFQSIYIGALSENPPKQEIQKSVNDYTSSINLRFDDADAYLKRASCHLWMGNDDEAHQDLLRASQLYSQKGNSSGYEKAAELLAMFSEDETNQVGKNDHLSQLKDKTPRRDLTNNVGKIGCYFVFFLLSLVFIPQLISFFGVPIGITLAICVFGYMILAAYFS